MKKATITFITSAALACAIPLYATNDPGMKSDSKQPADVTQQQKDQMQTGQMQSSQTITAEKLKGMTIISQQGEEIGEIETVKIDEQSGKVQFVTITKGAVLGMGGEEIAVPLSAFEIGEDKAKLTVDQSKLVNVPEKTAGVTDSDYQRDLETHYGVAPAWEKGDRSDTIETQQSDQNPTEPRKQY